MAFRQLFGNEHAAVDDLLEECYVPPPGLVTGKPILIGRWGAGKTGLLLHRNASLSREIKRRKPELDRIWYLDETALQLQTLKQVQELCGHDQHAVKRLLEDLWRSEILRCAVSILNELDQFYGRRDGDHWTYIRGVFGKTTGSNIWDLVPVVFGIISSSKERNQAFNDFVVKINSLNANQTHLALQKCLIDIRHFAVQPVVCIEPIETPNSQIEEATDLAQLLVTCLLNVFYKHFQPSERQLLRVEISIPWHRFNRDDVGEPQKLFPFIGRFKWTKSSLRSFINRRIEWEFRRIRKSFLERSTLDAWDALFQSTVRNSNTNDPEDTFAYILRHSQYRVRDILRLTREVVEYEAVYREETPDDVLHGRGGRKVSEKSIRAAIRETCRKTAIERVLEAQRRFPAITDYVEALRGLVIPFTVDDLKRRLRRRSEGDHPAAINKMLDWLWSSGIVGLQLKASSKAALNQLAASFGTSGLAIEYKDEAGGVFYLFEHLEDRTINDILNTYGESSEHLDIRAKLVVHPMMFEYLDIRPVEDHPIGI